MSFNEITTRTAALKQYRLMLQTNGRSMFRGLIFLEIMACLMSFYGNSYRTTMTFRITLYSFSGDLPLLLFAVYGVIMSAVLTFKRYTNVYFSLVSTRRSYFWAATLFNLTVSFVGALLSMMVLLTFRVLVLLFFDGMVGQFGFRLPPKQLALGVVVLGSGTFFAASVSQFLTSLSYRYGNKIYFLILAVVIGAFWFSKGEWFLHLFLFYGDNANSGVFLLKIWFSSIFFLLLNGWHIRSLEVY